MPVHLRTATAADAPAVASVYAPFVRDTGTTFELEPPDATEVAARITAYAASHAYLVAEDDGGLHGFAYAAPFAPRAAYRWACETSVYLAPDHVGRGTGSALYAALLDQVTHRGYQVAVAKIALPNDASLALHRRFGFEPVGVHRRIGFKLGRWWDVSLHQRELAPATDAQPAEPSVSTSITAR